MLKIDGLYLLKGRKSLPTKEKTPVFIKITDFYMQCFSYGEQIYCENLT